MKTLIIFTHLFCITCIMGATPHIIIGDLEFFKVYAPADSEVQLREYLPAGDKLERWTRLASVRIFKNEKNPKKYLKRVAAIVMKSGPNARAVLLENKEKNITVLDFMTFAPETAPEPFLEWNLMRAKYVENSGLVVYQYAFRIYNPGTENIKTVIAERRSMTTPFGEATFEEKE